MTKPESYTECKRRCTALLESGLYDEAVICANELLDIYETEQPDCELDNLFRRHSRIYHNIQKSAAYMTYIHRLFDLYKEQGEEEKIIDTMYFMSDAYGKGKELEKAVELLDEIIALSKKNGYGKGQADALNGFGNVYSNLGDQDTALSYYTEAYELARKVGYVRGTRFAHNIGFANKLLGNYDTAIQYFHITIKYLKEIDEVDRYANACNELGDTYRRNGDYDEAEHYLKLGMELCKQRNHLQYLNENYLFQTELYSETEAYKKALDMLKLHTETTAKLRTAKHERAVEQLKHQLELRDKETENQVIQAKNVELRAYGKELDRTNKALKEALEETRRMQNQLIWSEKDAAYNRMIVGIAHKVNTSFGNMLIATTHLQEQLNRAEEKYKEGSLKRADIEALFRNGHDNLETFRVSYNKIQRFMEDLRKTSVAFEEICETCSIDQLIESCMDEFAEDIKAANCTVRQNISNRTPDMWGKSILHRIFQQLFDNAFRHAFPGQDKCEIRIDVSVSHDCLRIAFEDNGAGIDETSLANIFDPFFTSNMGEKGGAGLGLYIVNKTVTEVLGGSLSCSSKVGVGTKFTLEVPIRQSIGQVTMAFR